MNVKSWMVASTAFYGTIGTFREFGTIILDVDKKMTDLKKVMSDDTDFGAIFDQATVSAETFGKTISESLDAYNMFAKQGFKGEELQTLSSAGLVAGNVGDIEAGKASEYLTASLLQWNKGSSEAMGVVDSWNEISNRFATTVENLAQGQAKAGATAKALGMDFNQLNAVIGTLNARTKQSGNEIGNFVKSSFSNLISNKGRATLDGLGVSLEDEQGNMRDIMEIYKDVATEYVKLNQADKNSVTLGLAGKYHISRMQTLLDDLGSATSMYDDMYDASKNSANSAMEENQKYMQSLEARINLAKVEVEKLALAIGEAFMTEGMVQALQIFRVFMETITSVVKEVGFLPPAILGVVTVLALLSNRFSDLIGKIGGFIGNTSRMKKALSSQTDETRALNQSLKDNSGEQSRNSSTIVASSGATNKNSKDTKDNTDETNKNTEAKKGASKASKLLSVGFGAVGIATVALGFALEGLLGWVSKNRKEQEDFDNNLKEQIASFEANEEQVKALSTRYTELSKSQNALDPATEEYAELTEVQNELARLLPQVKKSEDGLGNSIIQSAGYIEQKVAMLEKQLEIQEKINKEEAKAKEEEDNETARVTIDDSKKDIKSLLGNTGDSIYKFKNTKSYLDEDGKPIDLLKHLGIKSWSEDLKDAEHLAQAITKVRELLLKKDEIGFADGYVTQMEFSLENMVSNYTEIENANKALLQSTDILRDSYAKDIAEMVEGSEDFDERTKEIFSNVIGGALGFSETEDAFESLTSAMQFATKDGAGDGTNEMINSFSLLGKTVEEMKNASIVDIEEFRTKYTTSLGEIKEEILSLSELDPNSIEYKNLESSLNGVISKSQEYEIKLRNVADQSGKTVDEVREFYAVHGEGSDILDETLGVLGDYVAKLKELSSVSEKVVGVSESQISETEDLVSIYNTLSNATELNAREQELLTETMDKLKALYPYLTKNGEIRIDNIVEEKDAMATLLKGYDLARDGILNSEEQFTLDQAKEIMTRMNNLQLEADSIAKIQEQYLKTKKISDQNFVDLVGAGAVESSSGSFAIDFPTEAEVMKNADKVYESKSKEIEEYRNKVMSTSDELKNAYKTAEERQKDYDDSLNKTEKETDKVKEITDKYALSLEKIKTQLDKIDSKKKKYATHTANYRKALQEENKLLQEQISLGQQQTKELGGISPTSGSGQTVVPSGFSGQITSGYGAKESFRKSPHTGIDIAGKKGTTLQSNISGAVIGTGNNSISGNFVKIQDKDGYKHFYGHLDTIAVKLDQMINVSEKIGTIGNTGNVVAGKGGDGSHLHYEIKNSSGKNIDPTSYVNQAKSGVTTYNVNVSSSSSSSKSSSGSTQDAVWNFLKGKGLGDKAVAGVMGNIQAESGFNTSAKNKSSGAYGLVQWLGSRKDGLQNHANSKGTDISDLQTQLDFLWKELSGSESKTLAMLQNNGLSVQDYAKQFDKLFERSEGTTVAKRQSSASDFYGKYNGVGYDSSATISNSADSDEYLKQIEQLTQTEQGLYDKIAENNFASIKSLLENYEYDRTLDDNIIAKQELNKASLDSYTDAYEDSVNKQFSAEKRKLKNYDDELNYVNKILKSGSLNEAQMYEMLGIQAQLTQEIKESELAMKDYYSQVVQGRLDRYSRSKETQQNTIDWESVKIQTVDKASSRYNTTLGIMNRARENQVETIKQENSYVNKMLKSNMLTSAMYDELTAKAEEYKTQLIELSEAIHDTNLEIILSRASVSDESIDDIDFDISRSEAYSGMYEEGSADQKRELEYQLTRLEDKLISIEEKGKNIQIDMRLKDLGHEELQELEELLEDNALAFLEVKSAIVSTKKELADFSKIIDDKIKEKYEEVADDIIDALKDSYEELKDIEMKRIDDLVEAESKRHDKVMKQYQDELEAYTDIIDAKRRELDDEDRDRTHNNNLDSLTDEKQTLQNKLNLLSNVNTYEGKKEKEDLTKQIAEIDKQIVEENYQYEKELRGQQLDDLLDKKTEHIEELEEKEDAHHEETTKKLDKEKEYWEKHYEDILNNEREFERLRKEMLKGNFEEIQTLFNTNAELLKASLPDLALSFEGMTKTVGTQIRENVIYELENLLTKLKDVKAEVAKLNSLKTTATSEFGSSTGTNPNNALNNEDGTMKEADLKVILAKFMNEQIAGKLNPTTEATRIKNIKDKASILATEGRNEGATIQNADSLDSVFSSLNDNQIKQVGSYFSNNASKSGFDTQAYVKYIEEYGKTASTGQLLSNGDKQVLFSKYIREKLIPLTSDKNLKASLVATTDNIAQAGRGNLSLISSTVGYDSQIGKLTTQQRMELGEWMLSNSGVVSNGFLRSALEEYGENLKLSNDRQYVGLDTGGMIKSIGSSGGQDGKGGKMALLHQNEIVMNPVDTQRVLQVSAIMERIMKTISGAINLPKFTKPTSPTPVGNNDTTHIHINIDKMNGTQSDVDNLAKQIQNRLLREKGKR